MNWNINTMKRLILYSIITVMFLSCKEDRALLMPTKELALEMVCPDTIQGMSIGSFPGVQFIYSHDSLLFLESTNPECQLQVLSCSTHASLANLCTKGRAKNEFIRATSYCNQFYEQNGHTMLIVCDEGNVMKSVDITESLRQKTTVVSNQFNPVVRSGRGFSIYLPGKEKFFNHYQLSYDNPADEIYFPPRFTLTDMDGSNEYEYPVFGRLMTLPPHSSYPYFIYQGCMRIKPDESKVAFAHFSMPYLFLFDMKGNKHVALHNSEKMTFEDDYPNDDPTNIDACIPDMCVTEDYILALCANGKQNGYYSKGLKPMVRILNWDGDCLKSFTLGQVVSSIAFDEQSKQLFALDRKSEEIFVYDINRLFDSFIKP